VSGDDLVIIADQDWVGEAERLDAFGNLPDLLLRVSARVAHIGFDRLDCDPLHIDHWFFLSQLCRPSARL